MKGEELINTTIYQFYFSPWIDIINGNTGKQGGDRKEGHGGGTDIFGPEHAFTGGFGIPNKGQGFTSQPGIPTQGIFPSATPTPIPHVTTPKIPLATGTGNINVESWSPFSEEESMPSNTATAKTTTTKKQVTFTVEPESSEGKTNSHELPLIPFIPLPNGIPTGVFQTTTPRPTSFSPKFSRTSTTPFPTTYSTQRTTVNLPAEDMVSDPHHFSIGLDETLTTSAPGDLNCSERIKKAATELVPSPFCDCPAGQMRNINGVCVRSEISTFQARLMRVCGEQLRYLSEEAQILTWKVCL